MRTILLSAAMMAMVLAGQAQAQSRPTHLTVENGVGCFSHELALEAHRALQTNDRKWLEAINGCFQLKRNLQVEFQQHRPGSIARAYVFPPEGGRPQTLYMLPNAIVPMPPAPKKN